MKPTIIVRHDHYFHFPRTHGSIARELHALTATLKEGFNTMSEQGDALIQAVTEVASQVDTLTTSLQAEITQITDALNNAGSGELAQVVADQTTRLQNVAGRLSDLNNVVQGIVP